MKKEPTPPPRYLKVRGGDNDFGFALEAALRSIWTWAWEHAFHDGATLARRLVNLHAAGKLEPTITEAFALHHSMFRVEFCTRELDDVGRVNVRSKEEVLEDVSGLLDYLAVKATFHQSGAFRDKWDNGETAWLDIFTGHVGTT